MNNNKTALVYIPVSRGASWFMQAAIATLLVWGLADAYFANRNAEKILAAINHESKLSAEVTAYASGLVVSALGGHINEVCRAPNL